MASFSSSGSDDAPTRSRTARSKKLNAGGDEPLDAAAVETREARQVVVARQLECPQDEQQNLGILGADAVIGPRRDAELTAEPPHEFRRPCALGASSSYVVVIGAGSGMNSPRGNDNCPLRTPRATSSTEMPAAWKPGHQANDVHLGRVEAVIAIPRLQNSELCQPLNLLERAWNEFGELLRRDLGHSQLPDYPAQAKTPVKRLPK
jgi:hypothetical protein